MTITSLRPTLLQLRSTMRTFYRFYMYLRFAVRADFGCWGFFHGGLFSVQPGNCLDCHEDGEGNNQKLHDGLDEVAVGKDGCSGILSGLQGSVAAAVQGDKEIDKADFAGEQGDQRHDDVVDQGGDNVVEGGGDHYADSHVDHIPTHDKGFEFFCEFLHLQFLLLVFAVRP